jgi:hypothetical protein
MADEQLNEILERLNEQLTEQSQRLKQLENRKGILGSVGSFLYEYRQFCFGVICGFLLSCILPPFSGGRINLNPFQNNNPLSIVQTDSPQKIAKDAPDEMSKRKTIVYAYRSTAKAIQSKELTEMEDVFSNLRQETMNVLASPMWENTNSRIEKLLLDQKDLESLGIKLSEIADAFEQ